MQPTLFQGRWTPGPDAAEVALLQKRRYAALVVWRAMLRDALRRPGRQTARTTAELCGETRLSQNTVITAQRQLIECGYIRRASGGGATRKPAVHVMTMPENYGEKIRQQAQTEDWHL